MNFNHIIKATDSSEFDIRLHKKELLQKLAQIPDLAFLPTLPAQQVADLVLVLEKYRFSFIQQHAAGFARCVRTHLAYLELIENDLSGDWVKYYKEHYSQVVGPKYVTESGSIDFLLQLANPIKYRTYAPHQMIGIPLSRQVLDMGEILIKITKRKFQLQFDYNAFHHYNPGLMNEVPDEYHDEIPEFNRELGEFILRITYGVQAFNVNSSLRIGLQSDQN